MKTISRKTLQLAHPILPPVELATRTSRSGKEEVLQEWEVWALYEARTGIVTWIEEETGAATECDMDKSPIRQL